MKKILETKRLIITEASSGDAAFIVRLMNSPGWLAFIGDRGIKTVALAEIYIAGSLERSYDLHNYGLYVMCLKGTRTPLGLCGFIKRDYLIHPDLGFAILPEFEGKGYTFEACTALLTYGTKVLKLDPILAITTTGNIKSRRLLQKLGLEQQGTVNPKEQEEEFLLFTNNPAYKEPLLI